MSWSRKFVNSCVLVDEEELARLSSYDRLLVNASFARLVLGGTFAFLVFFYAASSYLPLSSSIVIATVLALIVFFVDQAIVGSEWSMCRSTRTRSRFAWFDRFLAKAPALLPRVVFAVAIAWFMATLAEISLQSHAIDRVLNERTEENNKEYFKKMDELEAHQDEERLALVADIESLEAELRTLSDPSISSRESTLKAQITAAENSLLTLTSNFNELETRMQDESGSIGQLSGHLARLDSEISSTLELRDAEIKDPSRCLTPGAEGCRGPRWNRYNVSVIELQDEQADVQSRLAASSQRLKKLQASYASVEQRVRGFREEIKSATAALRETKRSARSVDEISSDIAQLRALLLTLDKTHSDERSKLDSDLIVTGVKDVAEYGPLDRRLGLKALHDHPEYGLAARQFSWELKVVVILFELSPVLVAVLFAPFSFLGVQMRRKRDDTLLADQQLENARCIEEAKSRTARDLELARLNAEADVQVSEQQTRAEAEKAKAAARYQEEISEAEETRKESLNALAHSQIVRAEVQRSVNARHNDEERQELQRLIEIEEMRKRLLELQMKTESLRQQQSKAEREGDNHD